MTIPTYEKLMPHVLRLAVNETAVRDAAVQVADALELTEEERTEMIPSGGRTLVRSRLEWAVTYLVHAGLLTRPRRGHFTITDRSRKALAERPDAIDNAYLRQFPAFLDFTGRRQEVADQAPRSEDDGATPEEEIGTAYAILEEEVRSQLLTRILDQSPAFFEGLVVTLLSAMGYGSEEALAQAIGKVGDGGIDGIIHQDKLGLDVVYVQAKRYAPDNSVGRPELQGFIGALSGVSATKGVFVTTSRFSQGALDYLRTVQQRVITIDGQRLVKLMVEHGVGVKTKQVLRLHRLDEDFFIED